jgi:glycosyltransferase involved in cell wall biosynthesis
MKILYLSQYFPPEMGAPAARVSELSREWARLGHDVTVMTGFPNHPTGVVPPEYRGEFLRREMVDGIRVVRVPIYAAPNKGFFRRVLNYLSYWASASAVGPFVSGRPDVLIATSPQFLTAVAGLWISWLKSIPFVFEVRDLWPRSIVEVGAMSARNPAIRILEKIEKFLYRRADHIVTVTESFIEDLAAQGVDRAKMSVVTNGVDLDLFRPLPRDEARRSLGLPDGFLATYVGTHGLAHGLGTLLDAARLCGRGIHFLLVGEGAEKQALEQRAASEGFDNVSFWNERPRSEIARIVAASDVCLVVLRDRKLFRNVIPSKIFEFMGAGRAIVTTVDGESRAIVERAGAGIFSPPEDGASLAQLLLTLAARPERLEALGRAGRAFVEANYSRPVLARDYLDLLESVKAKAARQQP